MTTFGQQLRAYRRQCQDPMRKGTLTQVRLGELLGDELGDAGYSGAAVSDWERDQSKINADDRLVLVSLIAVLKQCGGLHRLDEANEFLQSGNYRALDAQEQSAVFPNATPESEPDPIVDISAMQLAQMVTPERRKQLILLEKVRQFWVEGVLEKSVQGAMLLALDGRSYNQAIDQPWQHVIGSVSPLPDGDPSAGSGASGAVSSPNLSSLFHESDRGLLILGEPGAGKTTTLISLANELITTAEQDAEQPIPAIFNLVSWAEKRGKLSSWLVEELTSKYQIPHSLGRQWLADDQLVLLLDGLDEVPLHFRAVCVTAINQFREQHGLVGIVVSSRREQYEALTENLYLGGATLLQPLTSAQIDMYLAAAGEHLTGLRTAVQQDPALQEMAQSPLTLHVLSAAYWQTQVVPDDDDGQVDSQEMFDTYVQAMYDRRGDSAVYPPNEVVRGLNWLAVQMDKHNQALFLVERLQPSWLRANRWKFVYILGSRLFSGLVAGLLMWLFWLMVRINIDQFGTAWSEKAAEIRPGPAAETDLWLMLFLGLALGLVTAVIDTIDYRRISNHGYPTFNKRKRRDWRTAVTALITAVLGTLFIGILEIPYLALSFGVLIGITFGLITYFVYGLTMRDDIRTVAAINWTWVGAIKGLIIGLAITTFVELIEWSLYGSTQIFRTYLSLGLVFTLLGGLQGHRVAVTSKPNQGVWLSATNALIAGGVLGLVMTGITAVLWQNITLGLVAGILSLLVSLFMYGGGNVVNHFYLRFLLWLTKDSPVRLINFLEFCVDRVFLHRVGGGYLFIHQMLQEYFASQDSEETLMES